MGFVGNVLGLEKGQQILYTNISDIRKRLVPS